MLLVLAAALPGIYWDGPPETVTALAEAGVHRILVPAERVESWKGVAGITAEAADLRQCSKLVGPRVNYQWDQAAASNSPWLDANGWRFLRRPQGRFYYETTGAQSALAAAEAFAWGANAVIKTDAAGLKPVAAMLELLAGVEAADLPPAADFGFVDDGSSTAGEVMNLLVRNNLLFRLVRAPDSRFPLTVRLGSKQYPVEQARNPGKMAHIIRGDLTDDRRSLRIFGSQVVVGRMTGAGGRLRLFLLNYDGAARTVHGLRVRVAGEYSRHQLRAAGGPGEALLDYEVLPGATEFTLPELKTLAIVDLSR